MNEKIKTIVKKYIFDESSFRYLYIISLLFSFVCIVEVPFQVMTYLLMPWALILIIKKIKDESKNIYAIPLAAGFVISGIVTAFIHISDNFFMNMLMMFHVMICFFIFYGLYAVKDRHKIKNEMIKISLLIIRASTALSTIGIAISLITPNLNILGYDIGLMDNRYTGLYTNPNLSGFVSVVAMIMCHLMTQQKTVYKNKTKLPIWLVTSCLISNFITLLLSDSNSSLIFLLIYIFVYTVCSIYKKYNKQKIRTLVSKFAIFFLLFVIISAGSYCLRLGMQSGLSMLMNNIYNVEYEVSPTGDDSAQFISLGRANEDRDVTSGRTDSWSKAMVLIKENPIMGIGKANIVEYANRYLARGLSFSDLHNGYLTILVSTGIIGAIIFLTFSILVARRIILSLLEKLRKGNDQSITVLFSAICAYCVYAFFEKAMLFDITFMVVFFWLILGYCMCFVNIERTTLVYKIKNMVKIGKTRYMT